MIEVIGVCQPKFYQHIFLKETSVLANHLVADFGQSLLTLMDLTIKKMRVGLAVSRICIPPSPDELLSFNMLFNFYQTDIERRV